MSLETIGKATESVHVEKLQSSECIGEQCSIERKWKVEKFDKNMQMFDVVEFEGNLMLNDGITRLLNLLIGAGGASYASAQIGVGSSNVASTAGMTALQTALASGYKAMEAGFPQVSGQTVTFKSSFGAGQATGDWQEFTVSTADGAGTLLNRKTQNVGVKGADDTWVITLSITFS